MKILNGPKEWQEYNSGEKLLALTIGNFDGVHIGHQELLKNLLRKCRDSDQLLGVMTFVPHPQKILNPHKNHFLINTYQQRQVLLEALGINFIVNISFDRDFSTLDGEKFLKKYVFINNYLKSLYLGHDFAFGANKQGGYELARAIASKKSINVELQSMYQHEDVRISSSLVRESLINGDVEQVNQLLGRIFFYQGMVAKGAGRGKKLGYPTANIHPHRDLLIPQSGVYITKSLINNKVYDSVTNVGVNPTFNDGNDDINVETHILDFNEDIYGSILNVQFLKKIRNEQKFSSVAELTDQISRDIQIARTYLN